MSKPNMLRRIEVLEKLLSAQQAARQAIVDRVLSWLSYQQHLEGLISAHGAERAGRLLTERESSARRAYGEFLEKECHCAGLPSSSGFEPTPNIPKVITHIACSSLSDENLKLLIGVAHAKEQGLPLTKPEAAVCQAYFSEIERLCQMAGLQFDGTSIS